MTHLHIDIETFSAVDLKTAGVHKYAADDSFEILVVAFAIGSEPVQVYDWEELPDYFFEMLEDNSVMKFAHNAAFERTCFAAEGYPTPATSWRCTMVKALYCGLPGSLDQLSTILQLPNAKLKIGASLIRYFCAPVKATKINGGRTRNLKHHNPEKWAEFKHYCAVDVDAERDLVKALNSIRVLPLEWSVWALDQQINDRGVAIDTQLAVNAVKLNELNAEALVERAKQITGLSNPNSLTQLKQWIGDRTGEEIEKLTKDAVNDLFKTQKDSAVRELLGIRQQLGKTSVKKFVAMLGGADNTDARARGLFQFYGASRTGRWSGRRIQLQNLPRNSMKDLALAREIIKTGNYDLASICFSDIPDVLSQLIRSAIVPAKGKSLVACDFSAIEARVIAWLAGEQWRLDVFATHGKIYEASASKMFNIPIEDIGKESPYRQRGKVAELALGYQGGVNALKAMGADRMGLTESEMDLIVQRWRIANPKICQLWSSINNTALLAVKNGRSYLHESTGIRITGTPSHMSIQLPSGRELIYWGARVARNRFGSDAIQYRGVDDRNQWSWIDTYGGKLVENIVQAVSRDLLAYSLLKCDAELDADIVLHVHDELAAECRSDIAEQTLEKMESLMCQGPTWAKGLPLAAEGWVGDFYRK